MLKKFGKNEESVLVRKAIKGSERAWLTLVKRYERRVYNYALRTCGNPDDAMDILQDTFVAVFRNLESYRGDGSFPAWLFRIAQFRATDLLRKRKDFFEPIEELPSQNDSLEPEAHLKSTHSNKNILTLMQSLSTDSRQIIELKFFQHFTFDEISGQLGISTNTAKSRFYAALKKMRQAAPQEIALGS